MKKSYEKIGVNPMEMIPMAVSMTLKVFEERGHLTLEQTEEFAKIGDSIIMALLRGEMVTVKDGQIVSGDAAENLMLEAMHRDQVADGVVIVDEDGDSE